MTYSDPHSPGPPKAHSTLFRFSLRKMLTYMGLLCVLFAAMSTMGGMFAIALLIFALVAAAHVLSTFVGTRLRDTATETARRQVENGSLGPPLSADHPRLRVRDARRSTCVHSTSITASQLRGRGPGVRRWAWIVASGSAVGALGFGGALWAILWPKVGLAAISAGAVAAAILGAWLTFLGLSFYSVSRRAWREAVDGAVSRPSPPQEIVSVQTAPDPG